MNNLSLTLQAAEKVAKTIGIYPHNIIDIVYIDESDLQLKYFKQAIELYKPNLYNVVELAKKLPNYNLEYDVICLNETCKDLIKRSEAISPIIIIPQFIFSNKLDVIAHFIDTAINYENLSHNIHSHLLR